MMVLARDCPLKETLKMERWLNELLYIVADAAAAGHPALCSEALDAFSTCLENGAHLSVQSATCNHADLRPCC